MQICNMQISGRVFYNYSIASSAESGNKEVSSSVDVVENGKIAKQQQLHIHNFNDPVGPLKFLCCLVEKAPHLM